MNRDYLRERLAKLYNLAFEMYEKSYSKLNRKQKEKVYQKYLNDC